MIWHQLLWPQPLDPDHAVGVLRQWASDQRSPRLILETRATAVGVTHLLGGQPTRVRAAGRTITQLVPGASVVVGDPKRTPVAVAGRLKASTRHRALRTDDLSSSVRAVLAALMHVRKGEQLTLQLVLGPRRVPLAVPDNSPSSIVAPWWQVMLYGNGGTVDSEKRSALRAKVCDHGFAATVRIGVVAATAERRTSLLLGLLAALRTSESPGLRIKLAHERAVRIDRADAPWHWPLRLNVIELAALPGLATR